MTCPGSLRLLADLIHTLTHRADVAILLLVIIKPVCHKGAFIFSFTAAAPCFALCFTPLLPVKIPRLYISFYPF
jgi:hypothetical protein